MPKQTITIDAETAQTLRHAMVVLLGRLRPNIATLFAVRLESALTILDAALGDAPPAVEPVRRAATTPNLNIERARSYVREARVDGGVRSIGHAAASLAWSAIAIADALDRIAATRDPEASR